jgi:hypothetical protein
MTIEERLAELAEQFQERAKSHGTAWNRERKPYDGGAAAAYDVAAAQVRGLLQITKQGEVQTIEKS